jgi:N6-L-threonylcarbamoyladenine synthase
MAAAVVRGGREIASSCVHGQDAVHRPYGGVVPELASRDHVRAVHQVVERALAEAGIAAEALDGIAVTAGPGLVGSLLVGLSFGKALAYRLGDPAGRRAPPVGASRLGRARRRRARAALSRLVVSGGHTALYRIERDAPPALLGETRDDAVGEAFDKVAALLGSASRAARGGARGRARRSARVRVPAPARRRAGLRLLLQRAQDRGGDAGRAARRARRRERADVAASFECAAIGVLVERARRPRARPGSTGSRWSAASRPTSACAASSPRRASATASRGVPARGAVHRQRRDDRRRGRAPARARRAPRRRAERVLARAARRRALVGVSAAEVRDLLARHGLAPSRERGQNFLVDERVAGELVELAGVAPATR